MDFHHLHDYLYRLRSVDRDYDLSILCKNDAEGICEGSSAEAQIQVAKMARKTLRRQDSSLPTWANDYSDTKTVRRT